MRMLRPIRYDVDRFIACYGYAAQVDLGQVPEPYRKALRQYLVQGVLPERRLRALLEGNVSAIGLFRGELPTLLTLADLLQDQLPAACWGSPDQVQHWITFARRSAQREAMEGSTP
jgi:hypothetical protein